MRVNPSSGTDFVRATFSRKGRRKRTLIKPSPRLLLQRPHNLRQFRVMMSLPQTPSQVMGGFVSCYCGFGGAAGVAVSNVIFQSLSDFVRTAPQCNLTSLGPDCVLM